MRFVFLNTSRHQSVECLVSNMRQASCIRLASCHYLDVIPTTVLLPWSRWASLVYCQIVIDCLSVVTVDQRCCGSFSTHAFANAHSCWGEGVENHLSRLLCGQHQALVLIIPESSTAVVLLSFPTCAVQKSQQFDLKWPAFIPSWYTWFAHFVPVLFPSLRSMVRCRTSDLPLEYHRKCPWFRYSLSFWGRWANTSQNHRLIGPATILQSSRLKVQRAPI